MVLMPGTPTRGVSRKAEDDKQRKQMKKALSSLALPENVGCIVRTAALDQTREELERAPAVVVERRARRERRSGSTHPKSARWR